MMELHTTVKINEPELHADSPLLCIPLDDIFPGISYWPLVLAFAFTIKWVLSYRPATEKLREVKEAALGQYLVSGRARIQPQAHPKPIHL